MDFEFKDKALLDRVYDKYMAMHQKVMAWADKHPELERNLPIDYRDLFSNFMLVFDMNFDMTDEEVNTNADKFYDELLHNPVNIFNKIQKFQEDFKLDDIDTTKEKDVIKALLFHQANQSFQRTTAMNPEYRTARYGSSVESMEKFDGIVMKSVRDNQKIYLQCLKNDINSNEIQRFPNHVGTFMYNEYVGTLNQDPLSKAQSKWCEDFSHTTSDYFRGKRKDLVFSVDEAWGRMDSIVKGIKTKQYDPVFGNDNRYFTLLQGFTGNFFHGDSYLIKVTSSYEDNDHFQNVFVNGKSLAELVPIPKGTDNKQDYIRKMTRIMAKAMKEGKPIDVLGTYVVNGQTVSKVYPITYNYSKEAIDHYHSVDYRNHSSFRIKYFNWGPFRIGPDYEKVNENNAKTFAKRSAEITKYWNKNIKPLVDENYEKMVEHEINKVNTERPERFRDFNEKNCNAPVLNNVENIFIKENDSEELLWTMDESKWNPEKQKEIKNVENNLEK